MESIIKQFKERELDASSFKKVPKNITVTKHNLVKYGVDPYTIALWECMELWTNVPGIGPVTAMKLWKNGVRLNNLSKYKGILPTVTQIALKHKPLKSIPWDVADVAIKEFIKLCGKEKHFVPTGSYRRNKPNVGDLDIVYISDTSLSKKETESKGRNSDDLGEVLAKLKTRWIPIASGPAKVTGIFYATLSLKAKHDATLSLKTKHDATGKDKKLIPIFVDIWKSDKKSLPAMILYSTGSRMFNVRMRHIAKHRGFKLNQYGLWYFKNGKWTLREVKTENDIFKLLKLKYIEPKDRT